LALEEPRYPTLLSPSPVPTKKGRLFPKGKKVTFFPKVQTKHEDHIIASALKDVRDRTHDMCCHDGETYESGEHACPPQSELLDTSGTKAEPGNINSLKIFVTDDQDAYYSLQADDIGLKDSVGEYQGLVGIHTLKRGILDFLAVYIKHTPQVKGVLDCPMSEVDWMTVLTDEAVGGVMDVFLFDGSDQDEEDQRLKEKCRGVANGDWTCLKECMSFSLPIS
jgi:hypothetical protein